MATKRLSDEDIERLVKIIKDSDNPVSTQDLVERLREGADSA